MTAPTKRPNGDSDAGAALVLVLAFVTLVGLGVSALLTQGATHLRATSTFDVKQELLYAADAGLERAVAGLRSSPTACAGAVGSTQPLPLSIPVTEVAVGCTVTTVAGTTRQVRVEAVATRAGRGSQKATAVVTLNNVALVSIDGWATGGSSIGTVPAAPPLDVTPPSAVAITAADGDGLLEPGDVLTVTFSEPVLAGVLPRVVSVELSDPPGGGNDTLHVAGLTGGAIDTGSDGYLTRNNARVTFAASNLMRSTDGLSLIVTVQGACAGDCTDLGAGTGTPAFRPASTITDLFGNAASSTVVSLPSTFRLF